MGEGPSIESQITYGIDAVEDNRTVRVPLKDLLYVYQTLGEFVRFFHQPTHYPTLDHVNRFLGDRDSEGFGALHRCYYDKLRDCWPTDIVEKFDAGDFDNPNAPFYYNPDDEL